MTTSLISCSKSDDDDNQTTTPVEQQSAGGSCKITGLFSVNPLSGAPASSSVQAPHCRQGYYITQGKKTFFDKAWCEANKSQFDPTLKEYQLYTQDACPLNDAIAVCQYDTWSWTVYSGESAASVEDLKKICESDKGTFRAQ